MIIVIANQKGGVGKSTIATNTAAILAAKHETLLIDHDTSHVSLNFFNRRAYRDDENLSHFHTVVPKDIDDMTDLLELEREMIVVDLGGFTDELAKAALVYSDIVVVPTSVSTQDMDGNIHFMETLDKLKAVGLDMNVVYVANNTNPRMKQPRIDVELDYITDRGYKLIATVPHYSAFSTAHGAGLGVHEMFPDTKASMATYELVANILKEVTDVSK